MVPPSTTRAFAAVALVAVLSVLATTGVRAKENYNTSLATSYNSDWLPAKATWYGAPTGAGPDDNGKDPQFSVPSVVSRCFALISSGQCGSPRVPCPSSLNSLLGGACGFKNTNKYPFNSMTSCGNQPIFMDGKGCGACYQVREPVLPFMAPTKPCHQVAVWLVPITFFSGCCQKLPVA
jgi:hypothetical protein